MTVPAKVRQVLSAVDNVMSRNRSGPRPDHAGVAKKMSAVVGGDGRGNGHHIRQVSSCESGWELGGFAVAGGGIPPTR